MSANTIKGFRVAVRGEDDGWVRAHLTPADSMKGALCVASISLQMCQLDDAIFDQFKTLCRLIAGAVTIDVFGVAPSRIDEQQVDPAKGGAVSTNPETDQAVPRWRCIEDRYSGELHYTAINSKGEHVFDSVNRFVASDVSNTSAEHDDMVLAASAPDLLAALQAEEEWRAREAAGELDPEWDYETMVAAKRRAAIETASGRAQKWS